MKQASQTGRIQMHTIGQMNRGQGLLVEVYQRLMPHIGRMKMKMKGCRKKMTVLVRKIGNCFLTLQNVKRFNAFDNSTRFEHNSLFV